MPLKSDLLRHNRRLQRCLVEHPAHVTPGQTGEHVALIQVALALLDEARIDVDEIIRQRYGRSTTAAVLAYKTKRKIINFSYQKVPDSIVGKMTIAKMDEELLALRPHIDRHEAMFRRGATGASGVAPSGEQIRSSSIRQRIPGFSPMSFARGSAGFDPKPANAQGRRQVFQMVPANGGVREVWILDKGLAAGKPSLKFRIVRPGGNTELPPDTIGMEEVHPQQAAAIGIRAIRLTGRTEASGILQAVSVTTHSIVASAQIAVLNPRPFRIGFLVFNDANPAHAKGVFTLGHANQHIGTLNELWGTQANLTFASHGLATFDFDKSHGAWTSNEMSRLAPEMLNIARSRMPGADRYVVLMPELESGLLGFTEDVIFIAQGQSTTDPTLAHEFGHSIGIRHTTADGVRTNLMYDYEAELTLQLDLNKNQIIRANKSPGTWRDLNP